MTEFDINQIPEEHKHTQHINPGTDTTINPVVIDDTYRERKHKGMEHCNLASVVFKGDGVAWIKCDELVGDCFWIINNGKCPKAHTPAHPPEAQQRIDAAIADLEREIKDQQWMIENYKGHHKEIHENISKALQYALALLQAGRK